MSGRWEGTAQIPADELNLIVDLSQEKDEWVGSIIIPGLGLKGAPLTASFTSGARRDFYTPWSNPAFRGAKWPELSVGRSALNVKR